MNIVALQAHHRNRGRVCDVVSVRSQQTASVVMNEPQVSLRMSSSRCQCGRAVTSLALIYLPQLQRAVLSSPSLHSQLTFSARSLGSTA